jgi:hypothetical protein
MNGNRGGFLRAVAAMAIGVACSVAAGNANAAEEIKMKVIDRVFVSVAQQWVDVLLDAEKGSETTWFLVPDVDEGEISAAEALAHLSKFFAQVKEDGDTLSVNTLAKMGVVNAIVPSKHGVAPKGLRYELTGLDDQGNLPVMMNPWVEADYGATPVSFAKAAFDVGDAQWGPAPVATLFPVDKPLSDGEKFRLTELPIQKAKELLQREGFTVAMQEKPVIAMMGKPRFFTPAVEECITKSEESSTPIRECYNLYRGRDENARWFEDVYQAAAKDKDKYGPFVATPLEREYQAWVE